MFQGISLQTSGGVGLGCRTPSKDPKLTGSVGE